MTKVLEVPNLSGLSRLDGATSLVTGGIGLSTAVGLSQLGATVIVTGRSADRGADAVRRIAETTNNPEVRFVVADLSTPTGVRNLAGLLLEDGRSLQLLVNNAGALPPAGTKNSEGVDLALAVNHWAPFLLTAELVPLLRASIERGSVPGARIVNVTSGAVHVTRFRLAAVEPGAKEQGRRSGFTSYAQSKSAALVAKTEESRGGSGTRSFAARSGRAPAVCCRLIPTYHGDCRGF